MRLACTLGADGLRAVRRLLSLEHTIGHDDPKVSDIHLHTSRAHDRDLADALAQMAATRDITHE